jgi:lipopolysaccharide transport system permease protein
MISPNSQRENAVSTTIIGSSRSSWTVGWPDLWRHRELFYLLAWRDIKVRYKQTVLGITWAILQPLAMALALASFLGHAVHIQPGNLPYPVFAYAGMVLWQLFAQGGVLFEVHKIQEYWQISYELLSKTRTSPVYY